MGERMKTDLLFVGIDMSATFSPCRRYRYKLWRTWASAPPLVVIGLNPSTADETTDDPTIRRCVGYARRWSCGGLVMLNLFAFRATEPKEMFDAEEPVGPENDAALLTATAGASIVLCAWGVHGAFQNRDLTVCKLLRDRNLVCLGLTKEGFPRHPLYMRGDVTPGPLPRKREG